MRKLLSRLLVAVVLVGQVAVAGAADNPKFAQNKNDPSREKPPERLKAGDPAPALDASKWLQGEQLRDFQPGKVYVIEFWATWCGPCLMIMPHLAELQA